MAINIRELRDKETRELFYPKTHVKAVVGLEDQSFFEVVIIDGHPTVKLKDEYVGFWAAGWISDGGIGTGGGGGGSTTLYGLNDVDIPVNPGTNDLLSYNGSVWVNVHKSDLLSGLATTQDLASKQDAYPFTITGQSGQTYDLSNLGVTVDNKNAEIGTTLTTIATVGGVDIKAKIPTIPSAPGTLVTNNSTAQTASSGESLSGTINLHKIAKTGTYSDLIGTPTTMKNPQALTFGSQTYDGSVAKTITASDLGALTSHQTVTLASGTNNGTLKITTSAGTVDNIAVKGLGSLAYLSDISGDYVTRATTQTISGAKTFTTSPVTLSGVNLLPATDDTCSLGANGTRINTAHIRNIYTSYFEFRNSAGTTKVGGFGVDGTLASIVVTSGGTDYAYKFYSTNNDGNGLFYQPPQGQTQHVPLGKSDHRWTAIYGVEGNYSGAITLSGDSNETRRIYFGGSTYYLELKDLGSGQNPRYALHTNAPFYSDQWIADGGIGSGSGGGGLITAVKSINDLGTAITTESLTETFSAKAIEYIYESVQGKQPIIDASHKLDYSLIANTPTIPTVPTNVSAFTNDAGYITSSALSDYVPTTRKVNNHPLSSDVTVTASDVGLGNVTNLAASGYFTAFEMGTGTDANKTKITVGGTTKSLTIGYATNAGTLDGTAKGSLFSALTNDNNQISITIGGTTKKLTVDYAGTAGSASRLSGNTAYSIWGVEYWASGVPKSVTAQPTLYIGKTRVKTSDSSNDTLIGISGFTSAASASAQNDTSLVVWEPNGGGTGVGVWHFKGNIVADGWIADGGIGSGSSGGMDVARMWQSLTNLPPDQGYENTKIAPAHIPDITTAKVSDIETWIAGKGYITSSALSGYATQTWVGNQGYLTSSALSGYATQNWVSQQGYLTADDLADDEHDIAAGKLYLGDGWLEGDTYPLTQKPRPAWKYRNGLTTVTDFVAMVSDIPSTLDDVADGSTRKLANYLPLAGGTMTGNITLNGVSILPSGDAVDGGSGLGYLGSSSKRFRQGHIRDIYTSYFIFKDGSTGATRGSINYTAGAGFLSVVDENDSSKTFAYKFYVNSNSNGFFYEEGSGANVPLGKSDHRWSKIWGIDGNLSGNLSLAQTSQITLGPVTITYDPTNKALHISGTDNGQTIGIYCDGWIADGGIQQTS